MNYYQLKYFQLAAQEENMTQAAIKANLSQQALSYSVSNLEKELDVRLFDRKGRKIILNQNGKIVLAHTDKILEEYSTMLSELRSQNNPHAKRLSIATTAATISNPIILAFLKCNDDITISTSFINQEEIASALDMKNIDFVIGTEPCEGSGMDMELLMEETLNLVVSSSHPLASRTHISLKEAAGFAFAVPMPETEIRKNLDILCKLSGFRPKVVIESNMEEALLLSVKENVAVAVMGNSVIQDIRENRDDISVLTIDDDAIKRRIYLIWKKKDRYKEHWDRFYSFITSDEALLPKLLRNAM